MPHRLPSLRRTTYALIAVILACGGDGPTGPVAPVPVADVQFDVAAASLYVGQARSVTVVARDAAGVVLSGRAVNWLSSDLAVATVTSAGVVTAVSPGSATITATVGAKSASLSVTVSVVPVSRLAIALSSSSVYVGGTITTTISIADSAGNVLTGRQVSWLTSDSAVLAVTSLGVVTGVAPGTADVIAEVGGVTAKAAITVSLVPVALVAVSPPAASLYVGDSVDLSASARDSAGNTLTGRTVSWSSSNGATATVSATGVVDAVSPGTATISATVEGKTAAATITVSLVPVATVAVAPASASLYVGQSVDLAASAKDSAGNTLTGRAISWSTSDGAVASVSATGVVTAVAPGAATITATVEGKTATTSITVSLVPVSTVTVSPASARLYIAQTVDLNAIAKDSAGNTLTGRAIAWSTANSTVATVSSAGLVTAVAPGSVTITATVEGKTATSSITVSLVPVSSVTVSPASSSLYVGQTVDLSASAMDATGNALTGRAVTWSTSNSAVASVSSSGVVTAVAPGTATIIATVEGKTATASITVTLVPVATLTVSPPTAALYVGLTVDLNATAKDSAGNALTGRAVSWSTANSGVATVSSAGLVTAVAPGTVTITATVEGKTASASITVSLVPVSTVAVSPATVSLYVAQTVDLSASASDSAGNSLSGRAVSWSTSNSAVASVSAAGVVTAVAPGAATITATVEGKTATASITVTLVPVATVAVSPSSAILYVGQTVDLNATAKDAGGATLTGRAVSWSTANSDVATVSAAGLVTAIAPGTVTITATVEGKTATASVTVSLVPVSTVTVSPATASLYVAETVDLSASARDSAGNVLTGRAVSWSTGNGSVASVSSTGVVTAVAAGTATITATVEGKSASATVTVSLVPVASVTISPATSILYLGQTVDLGAIAKDSAGNTLTGRAVTWSSSNSAVARVSATGIVTAASAGAATITATVEGKTGTATVTAAIVPVSTVTLSSGDVTLYQTATLDYDASAADSAGNPLTGRAVAWSSSNTAVATVSSIGLVTAVEQGEASITATVEGKSASATVTVRHDPIVFIHGFASNAGVWSTMTGRFAADGWRSADFVSWTYNSLQSNVTSATALKTTVDSLLSATGAKRVDIITHSMGGLPSRYYMKNLGGSGKVDAWVSLGGPNHGTDTATPCAGVYVSCTEMQIGSTFLSGLNSGDETAGASRYATWWSPCDATINPDDSVSLVGASNTQTACLGHSVLYTDLTVYEQVRSWVR